MGLLSWIGDLLTPDHTADPNSKYAEFAAKREWERDVWDTACKEWLLQSGLAPVMIEQTREQYGDLDGIEEWPPAQFDHYYGVRFDERRDDHHEIRRYIEMDPPKRDARYGRDGGIIIPDRFDIDDLEDCL